MDTTTEAAEAAKNTLVDEIRDRILKTIQDLPGKFSSLPEQEQALFIEQAALIATACVRVSCDIIAADGRTVLDCTIGKIDINDTTYTAKISIPKEMDDETRLNLVKADHGPAKLAFVDAKKHLEESDRPDPDPDQRAMFDQDNPRAVGDVLPKLVPAKPVSAKVQESTKPKDRKSRTAAARTPENKPFDKGFGDPDSELAD